MAGKRLSVFEKPELVPDQVHQVGRILAIMNGESGIEADLVGIFAKQAGTDTMEGAGPTERVGHDPASAPDLASDPLDTP